MFDKEQAREKIKLLVDKYNRVVESGKLKSYNEERTKAEFIEPLFEALGWDVRNTHNEDEVTREEKVSRGRVDYGFRINDIPKFFLEAKPLKADLDNIDYIKQAINYAWHKGATWAVLTGFEGIKIFNAEWKKINPLQAQFGQTLTCQKFLEQFDFLCLLSRESFEEGLLDKEAEKWGGKAKKVPVDKQLLNDLTRFRELLTKNIIKKNTLKNWSDELLDESVQRILDRLIFVRTLEDRKLEPPLLKAVIRENRHKNIYTKLNSLFRKIDADYNSKLFEKYISEELVIDDQVFEEIINGLFKTEDSLVHYDFGAIDADIMGNMYEQYLGHILRKTAKRAKITDGSAYRKEQGIYYTPTYIVDFIVRNTIGEVASNKKFDLDSIKVLDPACGSGSFLMKSFDYLAQLHNKNGNKGQTKLDPEGPKITYSKKVEILKNNIFGVDLDSKAVEIAQLNLLLKATEKRHRLPKLKENIKAGNSLVENKEISDKAFKWNNEFKDIMEDGGFDIVIGNPPWVSLKGKHKSQDISEEELNYYFETYKCDTYRPNLFEIFIWRSLELVKEGGFFSFIVPDRLCANRQFKNLRKYILENFTIKRLWFKVRFPDVISDNVVFVLQKEKPSRSAKIEIAEYPGKEFDFIKQKAYTLNADYSWFYVEEEIFDIFEKIINSKEAKRLDKLVSTKVGFIAKSGSITENRKNGAQINVIKGRNVRRFSNGGCYYFDFKKTNLLGGTQDTAKLGKKYKIFLRKTGLDLIASFDDNGMFPEQSVYFVYQENESEENKELLLYLLGLLNSRLINCYYQNFAITNRDATPQLKKMDLDAFPVIIKKQEQLTLIVKELLELNKDIANVPKMSDRYKILVKKIEVKEEELNGLVYSIYGLSKKEVKIVEEIMK